MGRDDDAQPLGGLLALAGDGRLGLRWAVVAAGLLGLVAAGTTARQLGHGYLLW